MRGKGGEEENAVISPPSSHHVAGGIISMVREVRCPRKQRPTVLPHPRTKVAQARRNRPTGTFTSTSEPSKQASDKPLVCLDVPVLQIIRHAIRQHHAPWWFTRGTDEKLARGCVPRTPASAVHRPRKREAPRTRYERVSVTCRSPIACTSRNLVAPTQLGLCNGVDVAPESCTRINVSQAVLTWAVDVEAAASNERTG